MKNLVLALVLVSLPSLANPLDGSWSGFDTVQHVATPYRELALATVDMTNLTVSVSSYSFSGTYKGGTTYPLDSYGRFNVYASGQGFNTHTWGRFYSSGVMTGRYTNSVDHTYGTITLYRENISQK